MSLMIYNVLGELVKVVDQGYKAPGAYTYNVSMNNFASGVYFYRLEQGSECHDKEDASAKMRAERNCLGSIRMKRSEWRPWRHSGESVNDWEGLLTKRLDPSLFYADG